MTGAADQLGTVLLSRNPGEFDKDKYRTWHEKIVSIAKQHGGLVDVDFQEPVEGVQEQWVQLLTYESVDHLKALLNDGAYKNALSESEREFGAPVTQQVIAKNKPSGAPVTVVISQKLKPGFEDAYQKWQLDVDTAASKFPGFLGTEMIRPVHGVQDEWVVVFRFDSAAHLDDWFASDVHREKMQEADHYFEHVQMRRVGRGFQDWFENAAGKTDEGPSQVRMAMVVLLALYPTVMLLTLYVVPLFPDWGLPPSMFVSNVLSVIILTWLVMPVTTRALDFWLDRDSGSKLATTLLGGVLIVGLYAASVIIFTYLTN